MVGLVSGRRTVEDIVWSEEIFPSRPFAEGTAPRSLGAVSRDVEKHALQCTTIQKMERELKDLEREKKSLGIG